MHISLQAVAFGVALLITGSTATVSLSSFTPRINNIPNSQCESAYTTTIKGCQASDFSGTARCSSACVQGLQEITVLVQSACKGVDVGEISIIGVFQFGLGITSLCPGVSVVTSSSTTSTSSTRTTAQTSTQAATSSRTTTTSAAPPPQSSSATTITTTTTLNTSTSAAQASTSSSQGLIVDPNLTSIAVSPTGVKPPASSTAAAPSQAPNAQLSNANSGGGSPFDVQATGASSKLRASFTALVGTAVLFVACA